MRSAIIYLLYAGILEGRNFIEEFWHHPDFLEALFNYQATLATLAARMTKRKVHAIVLAATSIQQASGVDLHHGVFSQGFASG